MTAAVVALAVLALAADAALFYVVLRRDALVTHLVETSAKERDILLHRVQTPHIPAPTFQTAEEAERIFEAIAENAGPGDEYHLVGTSVTTPGADS